MNMKSLRSTSGLLGHNELPREVRGLLAADGRQAQLLQGREQALLGEEAHSSAVPRQIKHKTQLARAALQP